MIAKIEQMSSEERDARIRTLTDYFMQHSHTEPRDGETYSDAVVRLLVAEFPQSQHLISTVLDALAGYVGSSLRTGPEADR
jgi:hypothetical protein